MTISIVTLFPQMFTGPFDYSIISRAQKKELVSIKLINLRDFATDRYGTVDDKPYGGGAGMILKVDVIDRAITSTFTTAPRSKTRVILLDAKGARYTQKKSEQFSQCAHLVIICGHYEGVDARVNSLVDEVVSIGDFVLTGGEIAAAALVDSIVRLLPGVLTKSAATTNESHTSGYLEYPQFTRPLEYKDQKVPEILVNGNHAQIVKWRSQHMKKITTEVTD